MTRALIVTVLTICLIPLTVLVGGGWAEDAMPGGELTSPKWIGLDEPTRDGEVYATNNRLEQRFDSQTIIATSENMIKSPSMDDGISATLTGDIHDTKHDKLSIRKIDFCKQICFKIKGDDIERCVETEWLYKWLKMMQP